jgi:PAS domain-containing protein
MSSNLEQLKTITNRLSRLESEYEGFFQVAPDLFAVMYWEPGQLRKDMKFSRVNRAWETVLGYTQEEMTSEPYRKLIHPDDVGDDDPNEPIEDIQSWDDPKVKEQLEEAARRAQAAGIEWNFDPTAPVQLSSYVQRWIHKDGHIVYISWRANFNLMERAAYMVGRDVTGNIGGLDTIHIKRHILKNISEDYLEDAIRDLTLSKDRLKEVIRIMEEEIDAARQQGIVSQQELDARAKRLADLQRQEAEFAKGGESS